jgi:uncharacterized membrane protein YedE/YeeE
VACLSASPPCCCYRWPVASPALAAYSGAPLSAQFTHLWRWLFLAGLIAGAGIAQLFFGIPAPAPSTLSPGLALTGGLLVGLGTRLGNGCTSGHGVCGIGLNSGRSTLATLLFMSTGIATVFLMRHVLGIGL